MALVRRRWDSEAFRLQTAVARHISANAVEIAREAAGLEQEDRFGARFAASLGFAKGQMGRLGELARGGRTRCAINSGSPTAVSRLAATRPANVAPVRDKRQTRPQSVARASTRIARQRIQKRSAAHVARRCASGSRAERKDETHVEAMPLSPLPRLRWRTAAGLSSSSHSTLFCSRLEEPHPDVEQLRRDLVAAVERAKHEARGARQSSPRLTGWETAAQRCGAAAEVHWPDSRGEAEPPSRCSGVRRRPVLMTASATIAGSTHRRRPSCPDARR